MSLFTKSEYAIEEAEFLFKNTNKPHSVVNYGNSEFVVMETERALSIFKPSCILETIRSFQGDLFDEHGM